jgi:hypothetical protein
MNRIAHPPRTTHAKPFGFGACGCAWTGPRGSAGVFRIDTIS